MAELREQTDVAYLEAGVRKERALLWADVALIAWQAHNATMTLQAAQEAVAESADPVKDKALCIAQAQVHFARGEALFMQLKQGGLEPGQPLPDVEANPKKNTALAAWCKETRGKVVSGFMAGIRLGRAVAQDWLCINGAAYLWNYHLPLFKSGQLEDLYEALEEAVATLLLCKTRDAPLFARLPMGLRAPWSSATRPGRRRPTRQSTWMTRRLSATAPVLGTHRRCARRPSATTTQPR